MVEAMTPKQSLKAAELQDGDIVAFQRVPRSSDQLSPELRQSDLTQDSLSNSASEDGKVTESVTRLANVLLITDTDDSSGVKRVPYSVPMTTAKDYYDFLLLKRTITFYPHNRQPANPKFELVLSSKNTYEQIAARVADEVGAPATHLRFYIMNNQGVARAPVKRNSNQALQAILSPPYSSYSSPQKPNSLMYEVLEMSLAELETKKSFKINWITEGITKEVLSMSGVFRLQH